MRQTQLLLLLMITTVACYGLGTAIENSVNLRHLEADHINKPTNQSRFNGEMNSSSIRAKRCKKSSDNESEERGRFSFLSKLKMHFKSPATVTKSGMKKPEIKDMRAEFTKGFKALPKEMETLKKNPELVKTIEKSPDFDGKEAEREITSKKDDVYHSLDEFMRDILIGLGGDVIAIIALYQLVGRSRGEC